MSSSTLAPGSPATKTCSTALQCLVFEGPVGARGVTGTTGTTGASTTSDTLFGAQTSGEDSGDAPSDGPYSPGDMILWTNTDDSNSLHLIVWNGNDEGTDWTYATTGLPAFGAGP